MADQTQDPEVEWLARRLAGIYSRGGWDNIMTAERSVYRRDAATVLAALRGRYTLFPGGQDVVTAAQHQQAVTAAFQRCEEHPAVTLNAVADAITKGAGWLPLSVRYGTAVLAIEAATKT